SVNNDFTFSDTSYGILRRLLFVPFDVRFHENPSDNSCRIKGRRYQDTNLLNDLRKEMNGIFNVAYEGLKRLLANDYVYTLSDRSSEEVERYIRYSNPISAFLDEEIDMGVYLETSKSDINKVFASWQIKNAGEYKSITASAAAGLVEARLKELGKHVLEKKVNGSRVLEGVGLKAKQDIHMVSGCENKGQNVPAVI
ncbi:MAG TPA: hypothetical protein GX707_10705, partial [Epulopiscium sp.]|nr:hypothetical protein [Candidatus Epulonipiscium sp.]